MGAVIYGVLITVAVVGGIIVLIVELLAEVSKDR